MKVFFIQSGSVATVSDAIPNDIDPWTLMDPTDVVQKMRKDFDELVGVTASLILQM